MKGNLRDVENLPLPNDRMLWLKEKYSLFFCITMVNEPFNKLVKSLSGIYWAYYELCAVDEAFKDKCQIFIIDDGYKDIPEDFILKIEFYEIYNEFKPTLYRSFWINPRTNKSKHYYSYTPQKIKNFKIRPSSFWSTCCLRRKSPRIINRICTTWKCPLYFV
jgi:hypothetical protein